MLVLIHPYIFGVNSHSVLFYYYCNVLLNSICWYFKIFVTVFHKWDWSRRGIYCTIFIRLWYQWDLQKNFENSFLTFWESWSPSPVLHPFPNECQAQGLTYSGGFLPLSPVLPNCSSSVPFLCCSSKEAHPPKGRWILGTWSLSSMSSPGKQINLVNSYSHYLFSLSYHLLFSVFQHFL